MSAAGQLAVGGGAFSDTAIRPSVCLSHGAAAQAIGTLAACSWPATRYVQTAGPSATAHTCYMYYVTW